MAKVLWLSAIFMAVALSEAVREKRQADFDFPGPRRQHSFSPAEGRPRSRPSFRPPPPDSGEGGGLDDLGGGGFSPLPPPRSSFRPQPPPSEKQESTGIGGGRFSSRPSFSSDGSNEADFGVSKNKGGRGQLEEEAALEEEKKPDRLTLLLQESKFACSDKKAGYYADDGLSCEVFHYCNEGVRHSWMCPAGTSFHQIHLICMAEGGDNICKQSNKYHFVNDYLYKALPDSSRNNNGTIKYADRYFPEEEQNGGAEAPVDRPQRPQQHAPSRPTQFNGGSGEQEEQFFPIAPPSRHHPAGDDNREPPSRFRPQSFDEGQFLLPPPNFASGGSGSRGHHSNRGSGEDLGAFGSEQIRFQPQPTSQHASTPARISGSRSRPQHIPRFQH
ncbi:hypothetical protein CHUAL_006342 [Chamberlinius hualienensis]